MIPGFGVYRCTTCGVRVFPERLLCPRCHGSQFAPHQVHEGVVEEISVIRHMIGQADWKPRRIANVRAVDGPMLTVGLLDDCAVGATIDLFQHGAAPFGKARSS
jgi:uncharacterized OB-fold protein